MFFQSGKTHQRPPVHDDGKLLGAGNQQNMFFKMYVTSLGVFNTLQIYVYCNCKLSDKYLPYSTNLELQTIIPGNNLKLINN